MLLVPLTWKQQVYLFIFLFNCVLSKEESKVYELKVPLPFSDCLMLGTEIDLQQVENNVLAVEAVLKAWFQEQGGDREHLHLLLPSPLDSLIPGTRTADTHALRTPLLCLYQTCVFVQLQLTELS